MSAPGRNFCGFGCGTARGPVRATTWAGLLLTAGFTSVAAAAEPAQAALNSLMARGIPSVPEKLVQYAAQGDLRTVSDLLDAGLDPSIPEPTRQVTALHNAAATGQLRVAERLLDAGATVDAQDWQGLTPLINAAHAGHIEVARLLIARHAFLDLKPQQGPTALVAAAQAGNSGVAQLLLAHGAKPDQADCFGTTPWIAARRAGHSALLKLLEQAGASAQ